MRELSGRVEVAEKMAGDAVAEVKRLRIELAALSERSNAAAIPAAPPDSETAAVEASTPPSAPAKAQEVAAKAPKEPLSAEVTAYRSAYATWRGDDHDSCVDEFRSFLQTYPASPYADDALFWMADCHFKQGDYRAAVLRFDDVVRKYPTGNKAPDALFREGESLLKLGPSYHEAAKRAFRRVLSEYPDSARAREAKGQLDLISAG
jgi:tol-pal system protein YbgF